MFLLSSTYAFLAQISLNPASLIKALVYALVEGISEWLPISSTGHLILLNQLLPLDFDPGFSDFFLVIIQLAAILAVVFLYWSRIFPLEAANSGRGIQISRPVIMLWLKILLASLPAGLVGILFDDWISAKLYTPWTVAVMLILVGFGLWWVEHSSQTRQVKVASFEQISYKAALVIGCWQVMAAVLPGTSRSGACIIGGLLLGLSRPLAAEFSFLMAIPAMFGASLLKLVKLAYLPTRSDLVFLVLVCLGSFIISLLVIKKLLAFVKQKSYKPFAYYRIGLGLALLVLLSL